MSKATSNVHPISNSDLSKKKYSPNDMYSISPTPKQHQFFKEFDNNTPIISQIGSAGTGKTYVAMYKALCSVFEQTEYHRVVIVRSAVESRSMGFLPGKVEEKQEKFEQPYKDIITTLISCDDKSGHYENLKSLGYVEFLTTSYLRGITLDNAIVIVDECQNLDYGELSTIITRLGNHSRLILCGDYKQNDLMRNREKSGLHRVETIFGLMEPNTYSRVWYTTEDIIRGDIAKAFLVCEEKLAEIEAQLEEDDNQSTNKET